MRQCAPLRMGRQRGTARMGHRGNRQTEACHGRNRTRRYAGTEKADNLVTWVYDGTSFTPVAKVTDGERYTIVHDYLGTPTQAYDSEGNLVWEMLLDVYGEVMESRGDRSLVPFRYQGQYEDEETGLYYNRFRYYSLEMGMYISSDPIGLAGNNPTLYGYVGDVNTWLDVLGLFPFYRGAKEAQSPSFEPRPPVYDSRGKQIGGDYKINRTTGLVQPTHGVSVFDNPQSIREKGFTPYELDESSISDKLIIKQRGKDPKHF